MKWTCVVRVVGVAFVVLGLLAGVGCGKKDPAALCETILAQRAEIPVMKDATERNKGVFMEYCTKLPAEYLACEASDDMSEGCIALIKKHQGGMNDVIMSGKLPGAGE